MSLLQVGQLAGAHQLLQLGPVHGIESDHDEGRGFSHYHPTLRDSAPKRNARRALNGKILPEFRRKECSPNPQSFAAARCSPGLSSAACDC